MACSSLTSLVLALETAVRVAWIEAPDEVMLLTQKDQLPAWQWDEQAVQSTNQRMEGLAINALLVQLYQPELLTTGPAAKVRSGKGFAGAADPAGTVSPQGPVWIGKDFRLDSSPGLHPATARPEEAAPLAGPIGAAATGTPCCMGRSARAGGCSGFSRCTWG